MGLFSVVTKPIGCILSFIGALVVLAVLLVVGMLWAAEEMAPEIAERTFTEATGFPTKVGDADVSFLIQRLSLTDVKIDNPSDFPDREFMTISEFAIGLDRNQTNEKQLTLSELTIDIEELAFLQGTLKMSNLEAFIETAERNWEQVLEQVAVEAAEQNQAVPEKLVISELNLRLNRVKLVDTSGPETIYRALDLNYNETFENVSEVRPVLESIAQELQERGLSEVAAPLEKSDEIPDFPFIKSESESAL